MINQTQLRWELLVTSVFVFAFVVSKRTGASWKCWFYGAAVFVIFRGVLRLPWMMWLNFLLRGILRSSFVTLMEFVSFAALTAALFEQGRQWILFRKFIKPEEQTPGQCINDWSRSRGYGGSLHWLDSIRSKHRLFRALLPPTRSGRRSRASYRSGEICFR